MRLAKILVVVIPLAITVFVIYLLSRGVPSGGGSAIVSTISPDQLKKRLEAGEKLTIIDVREPEEWNQGHIPEAKLIPLGQIASRSSELDPNQEIILVCRSGNRSGQAQRILTGKGFKKTVNMVGGMLQWKGKVLTGR